MKRVTRLLNENWIFEKEGISENVNLPHTWNNLDGQNGGNNYYRGECRYTHVFDMEKNPGTEYYLEFRGVNASSRVIFNDKALGEHHGGYSTFRFPVTDVVDKHNTLIVYASNEKNEEVYPQMADFTFYGGIYRDVILLEVSKFHLDLMYYGTPGLKVTGAYNGDTDQVLIEAFTNELQSSYPALSEEFSLSFCITDAQGQVVSEASGISLSTGKALLTVNNPHLWDGLSDPYLYNARVQLVHNTAEKEVVDEVSAFFGIRTFSVDSQKGFILNGRSYPLHGVSRHQDYKNLGNAIGKEHHDKDMELIREMGCNTIRLAHYQHDQYFYDLCDKTGMIVWAEIPYISSHLSNGNENTVTQMNELIVQNYNHPSIVTWGLSNEITISNRYPAEMIKNHHALNDLCHSLDKQRFTTLACYAMCNPFSKVVHLSDVVSYNLYLGWYVPGLWLNDVYISLFHRFYPKRCLGYSEYGAEAMPNLHSTHPHRGDHTEDYQAIYHEYMIKCFARHPYMWATHVWNMFDFAADARNQGGEPGMNHKGLVTFDRSVKKDSFYLYKCYWNPAPMVHITAKRFVERTKKNIEIKVYSNAASVSLYLNNNLISEKTSDHIFKWKVKLEDGENKVRACIRLKDGKEISDEAVFIRKDDAVSYSLKNNTAKSANWM